ncbi:hypothetical protein C8Q70DRAFT_1054274 [Cubamyces menziesii]|nr:hypothetical protein C8Q70DRAFT_1054274 [Cubamyces menziesii]
MTGASGLGAILYGPSTVPWMATLHRPSPIGLVLLHPAALYHRARHINRNLQTFPRALAANHPPSVNHNLHPSGQIWGARSRSSAVSRTTHSLPPGPCVPPPKSTRLPPRWRCSGVAAMHPPLFTRCTPVLSPLQRQKALHGLTPDSSYSSYEDGDVCPADGHR